MPEIIKAYRQEVPALRFIGKRYGDADRVDGGFGKQWGEWFENGCDALKMSCDFAPLGRVYADAEATIGLMRWKDGAPFQYWIGMFCPAGAPVPEGFGSIDFEAAVLGVCWLRGKEDTLYGNEHLCARRLEEEGYTIADDGNGAWWFFERYGEPRLP